MCQADSCIAEMTISSTHCRYLEGVENFDAAVYGVSPAEALVLDPQQRLMLEVQCFTDGSTSSAGPSVYHCTIESMRDKLYACA